MLSALAVWARLLVVVIAVVLSSGVALAANCYNDGSDYGGVAYDSPQPDCDGFPFRFVPGSEVRTPASEDFWMIRRMLSADVNGDGRVDVITSDFVTGSLNVFLSQEARTYDALPRSYVATDVELEVAAVVDMDGVDGPDILAHVWLH